MISGCVKVVERGIIPLGETRVVSMREKGEGMVVVEQVTEEGVANRVMEKLEPWIKSIDGRLEHLERDVGVIKTSVERIEKHLMPMVAEVFGKAAS